MTANQIPTKRPIKPAIELTDQVDALSPLPHRRRQNFFESSDSVALVSAEEVSAEEVSANEVSSATEESVPMPFEYWITPYGALCALATFLINDIPADVEDFGDKYDTEPENAEPYGCGNMQFIAKAPTPEILAKYRITVEQYLVICQKLDAALSFGTCGWCT